jgi:DNA-binding beta-propeller fold protein YncE
VTVGPSPQGIAYNPANGGIYVANSGPVANVICFINPLNNSVSSIPGVLNTAAIVLDPDNGDMYATSKLQLFVIDSLAGGSGSKVIEVLNGIRGPVV